MLGKCGGVQEASVYGVEVPGADGRAGMATLVVGDGFDLDEFGRRVEAELPRYARPLFLRTREEVDITTTFKHRKADSVREGFDPATVDDPLYFLHPDDGRYVALGPELHAEIVGRGLSL